MLVYFFVMPDFERLKYADIARLKISTVQRQLTEYDFVLLRVGDKLVADMRAMAVEAEKSQSAFTLFVNVIMEMDHIFHSQRVVNVA